MNFLDVKGSGVGVRSDNRHLTAAQSAGSCRIGRPMASASYVLRFRESLRSSSPTCTYSQDGEKQPRDEKLPIVSQTFRVPPCIQRAMRNPKAEP